MIRKSSRVLWSFMFVAIAMGSSLAGATQPSDSMDAAAQGAPSGVPDSWLAAAVGQIADSEYAITWQNETVLPDLESSWQAPNRAQDFRTYFTEGGIRMVPRSSAIGAKPGGAASWEWSLQLARWGRSASLVEELAPAHLRAQGNRVDYDRGPLVESYVNDRRGLKQGFTIANAVDGKRGVVHLDLALGGTLSPLVAEGGQAIDFATPQGVKVVHYAELRVTDARGTVLHSWMDGFSEPGLRGIRILYDDTDAVYPVTIDPLATSAVWTAESDQASAAFGVSLQAGTGFGVSVATAGDVNGDGYSDVVVGAYLFDNGQTDEGRAFLYLGSAAGLSTSTWTAESDQASAQFGYSVATAGDVNGDGYSDVIVGAYLYNNPQTDEGRAYVYLGSASGLSATAAWMAESDQASAQFGYSVAAAGDVNGDGYSDVIVGARLYDNGQTDEGRAYVYLGSAAGLSAVSSWTAESDQVGAIFGHSVATAGDVNGDGYADVTVGARDYDNGQTDEGRAYVYLGSAAGLSAGSSWTAESDQVGASFGVSVATAGDVNGDGYADVVVGANAYDKGRAYVYLGSAAGLSTAATWTVESDEANANFGVSVATAGDVNGDGYADVVVGAYLYDNGQTDEGRAYVYLGSAAGLSTIAAWTAESDQVNAFFGYSVATAGDVNGDGYADVIVGAYLYDSDQTDEGRAFFYLGSATGLSTAATWTAESDEANANFGVSVATAGDVNGDGYGDVVVGAYLYDNGQTDEGRAFLYLGSAAGLSTGAAWTAESDQLSAFFGYSVATAGDVNGDGYADVVVGSYLYDNGQADEGRAYVYLGSASGLSATAAWMAESDQASAQFGYSVAAAGDVNGDGYSDVIVGVRLYDNDQTDEGRAYVYLGSASGLSAVSSWTAESDQVGAIFGHSVATAGDVNGDGYADVTVGARDYDNGQTDEGRAYVYLGSAAGLSAGSSWTAESDQVGASFGVSVATAGDVNGDGYADVVVGANAYDNVQVNKGRAYVYLGSAAGLSTAATWTVESDEANANFGVSVATAGDVNGDGYADVVVGAYLYDNGQTDEGRAYVYLGSAAGLSTIAAWTAESDELSAFFGYSVATAGDVNGDGYADVIVGAYQFGSGQTNEGRAFVYYGNGGRGLSSNPRQRRTTAALPIAHLGASDSADSFRVNLLGRTPFGRGRARLEWEVKPLGTPLNGLVTAVGATASDTGTAGVELSELATGLFPATPYHWRVRLRYDLARTPFAQRSRWLTMPWKGSQEAMLRTATFCTGKPNGTACDDSSACTTDTACSGGSCVGSPVNCNDNNACTNDSCDAATGCAHVNNTGPCDDGNACTLGDICSGGACAATPVSCGDNNVCTDDACNPTTGQCGHQTNTASCSDGSPCTTGDVCSGGVCAGTSVSCNDNNLCTNDSCDTSTGCMNVNNTVSCDDGNACTTGDACASGSCSGVPVPAPAEPSGVRMGSPTKNDLVWNPAANATTYDVLRGGLSAFPVGPGGGDESCLGNVPVATLADVSVLSAGTGVWYLVRGRNTCFVGDYGRQGSHGTPGAARLSTTCP